MAPHTRWNPLHASKMFRDCSLLSSTFGNLTVDKQAGLATPLDWMGLERSPDQYTSSDTSEPQAVCAATESPR